ncbi:hypothetical protein [Dyadobacter psychrotolerans]|uniref:AlgX/AlgJ SGNH hydrolase-like domain-containing protein n=1 Tax=Dyadobacter psychrotolerans TaxID=2541721 RepID=A0A4R5DYH0_9BACT|nr:hypothetical protein [Dyadobacter psychrotolerans]TDE16213.1 hypothetical protein E0F88_08145 [Dyadobacter psychrotolerans]
MRYLRYIFLLIGAAIWIVALSPDLSSKMTAQDSYRFGDLYRLSNLSQFKDPRAACPDYKAPAKSTSKKVHLYLIGDSFTEKERVGQKDFAADAYTNVRWGEVLHFKPDPAEVNILLIESVERHFRDKFTAGPLTNLVADSATFVNRNFDQPFMNKLDDAFRSKSTEGRLDEILFQNDFVLALKQLKADFNYKIFNRVNKEVTRVNDDKNIVYYMDTDTDTTKLTSSFSELSNSEVDSLVIHLNKSREIALKLGFDAVVLSIIPNKVSVLMPDYGHYNSLIDKVYSHPALEIPYIDVYQDFRKMGDRAYLKGDSHWTCAGQYLWLNKANQTINQLANKPIL